ncbi:MAG: lysophospholipid acyltransferase family protein [Bacteroidales bacterium]|nr:lysophospholipid acyltransferase family protein [Lentimicrobiaceae bacterium]MDD5695472.1 lysophospholipid acyltransferase family protein [Bacteroidales bacterium]
MIRAQHTLFHTSFFRLYTQWMIRHHFSSVTIKSDLTIRDLPVLLIGNHFSWWDGFIANYLNCKIFKRDFYIMMLEEQLKQRMFLSRAGAFSIAKGKRSMVETISYAADILQNKNNLLVLYPQGKFQSIHDQPIVFEKGYFIILKKALESGFQLVFYVALTDYFSFRKPLLMIYLKEQPFSSAISAADLEALYHEFYMEAVGQQKGLI